MHHTAVGAGVHLSHQSSLGRAGGGQSCHSAPQLVVVSPYNRCYRHSVLRRTPTLRSRWTHLKPTLPTWKIQLVLSIPHRPLMNP
jgi:hypothetical protein